MHFLPLPLAGWLASARDPSELFGGVAAWACALAYTSAVNQAFDDRLDRPGKNPVGAAIGRTRAIALSLPPAAACLALLALLSPSGLVAGVAMLAAATLYSAPPRLKRVPLVGTLWNPLMAAPGFFFAGRASLERLPVRPLLGLFALLLLISQLLHEAQDRDDDAAGGVRTMATLAGRPAALGAALLLLPTVPLAAWWLAAGASRQSAITVAAMLFSAGWGVLLARRLQCTDPAQLQWLRLAYRWSCIALGALTLAALQL